MILTSHFLQLYAHFPLLVDVIFDWVGWLLPHIVRIREWSSFFKRFGPYLPSTSKLFLLLASQLFPFLGMIWMIFVFLCIFLNSARGSSKKSKAPAPVFGKRKMQRLRLPSPPRLCPLLLLPRFLLRTLLPPLVPRPLLLVRPILLFLRPIIIPSYRRRRRGADTWRGRFDAS